MIDICDQQNPKLRGRHNLNALSAARYWEALGQLRTISILRIGYFGVVLIPVLCHLINEWNSFGIKHISLPFTLFLVFLGSTFLAIGHILNEVFCPKLIKFYGSVQRYQHEVAEFVKNEDVIFRAGAEAERRIVAEELEKFLGDLGDSNNVLSSAIENVLSERKQNPVINEPIVSDYREEWEAANKKFFFCRIVILCCYFVAALIALSLACIQLHNVFLAAEV